MDVLPPSALSPRSESTPAVTAWPGGEPRPPGPARSLSSSAAVDRSPGGLLRLVTARRAAVDHLLVNGDCSSASPATDAVTPPPTYGVHSDDHDALRQVSHSPSMFARFSLQSGSHTVGVKALCNGRRV